MLFCVFVVLSWFLWRSKSYHPLPEALQWVETGTNAIRDGSYFTATKALERAILLDSNLPLAHARLAEAWTELDSAEKANEEMLRATAPVPGRPILAKLDEEYLQAIHFTTARDFSRALQKYQQILKDAPDAVKPHALVDLGRAYENNSSPQEAVRCYLQATQLAHQYPTAFLRLGVMYARLQDAQHALEGFRQAEALYQASSNLEGVAEVCYQRGLFANNQRDLPEAQSSLQRALGIARTAGNTHQQIRALLQLSIVAFERGDTQAAQQSATEAVALARTNGIENLTVRGLIDLGSTVFVQGDYGKAEAYFRDALNLARQYHSRRLEARSLFMLGSLRIQQDNPDEGIRSVQEALAFYVQNGFRKEAASAWLLIGRGRRDQADFDSALSAFQQQLKVAETIPDRSVAADAHESIGGVLLRQERFPEAVEHFREDYTINKSMGNTLNLTYASLQYGETLWRLGRYADAGKMYDEAAALAGDSTELKVEINISRAEMLLSQRRLAEAKMKCRLALPGAASSPRTLAEVKRILGLAQILSGEGRRGRENCQASSDIALRLRDPWLISQTRLAMAEAIFAPSDAQAALAMVAAEQPNLRRWGQLESQWRAFVISVRAARSIGDQKAARQFSAQARDVFSELKRKWGATTYNDYATRPDIRTARAQLAQLSDSED